MPQRVAVILVVALAAAFALSMTASAGTDGAAVSIDSVNPSGGPPGTDVSYALAGTDEAGSRECAESSAYRLEFLASDGTLAGTGGETVAVPDGAASGNAFIRLVCYVPDATTRRVIHGLCGAFVVTAPGESAPDGAGGASDCPPTPRVTLSQSVIAAERAMSQAFNPTLYYPFTK